MVERFQRRPVFLEEQEPSKIHQQDFVQTETHRQLRDIINETPGEWVSAKDLYIILQMRNPDLAAQIHLKSISEHLKSMHLITKELPHENLIYRCEPRPDKISTQDPVRNALVEVLTIYQGKSTTARGFVEMIKIHYPEMAPTVKTASVREYLKSMNLVCHKLPSLSYFCESQYAFY